MGYINTTFLGKEYSIPEDVIAYVGLVDFTNEIRDALMASFRRKIRTNIDVIESDDFMIADLSEQASKFVRKLLDNDVYNRTTNDYFQNNKGYDLFIDTKKKILKQLLSIRTEKLETYRAGVEDAIHRKESSVTGLDFGIISGSFVNHMIYAYMDASKQTKQEKEALKTYNREIAELDKQAAEFDRQENSYVSKNVIPAMNTVFTFFAYELLDKYVSDLIKAGKFDKVALDYIDLEQSNDLLKNLGLSNKRTAILESAFVACPFNIAVYMQAMKYDLLDYDSFQTAKVFKQDHHILSFFRESWGEVSFPTKFNINYHCINVWASITGKSSADLLRGLTEQYATGIVKAYSRVADIIRDNSRCEKIIGELREDVVLSGASICNGKAREYIEPIVALNIWEQLTERCGHFDLLGRIKNCFPSEQDLTTKKELDSYITAQLAFAFEEARKAIVAQIEVRKQEEERQRIERERIKAEQDRIAAEKKAQRKATTRKIAKRIGAVVGIVAAVFVALIIAVVIYLFATDKPIDSDFANREVQELHNLTYYVPDNWEYSADESSEKEKLYARYDNWGNLLGLMSVLYEGDSPDTLRQNVVSEFENASKSSKTQTKTIGKQSFDIVTFTLDSNDGTTFFCNVYITEQNHSVFYVVFSFVEESNIVSVYEEIIAEIAFEEYVNPKESTYNEALSLMSDGKYADAYDILKSLGDYKNSNSLVEECLSAVFDENIAQLIATEQYGEAYRFLVSSRNQEQLKHFKAVYTISSYSDKYYDSNSVYTYDEFGNLLKDVKTYEDGDKKIKEYTYDSNNRLITGRITESDSPSDYFETTYEYNTDGQKIKEITTYDYGNGNAGSYTYKYEYNPNGNMVSSIYSKAGESGEKVTKYEYNSNGQITKELCHDGTYYYFEYGTNNELLKKVYVWSDGHESFDSYQYDDNGVLVKEMDSYGNSIEYYYDSNYCLIKMVEYDEDQIDSVTEYGDYIVFYLFDDRDSTPFSNMD